MSDRPGLGFLHLGYPKGASTFLQKEVFVPAQGIYNIFEDAAWERFLNLSLLRLQDGAKQKIHSFCHPLEKQTTTFRSQVEYG